MKKILLVSQVVLYSLLVHAQSTATFNAYLLTAPTTRNCPGVVRFEYHTCNCTENFGIDVEINGSAFWCGAGNTCTFSYCDGKGISDRNFYPGEYDIVGTVNVAAGCVNSGEKFTFHISVPNPPCTNPTMAVFNIKKASGYGCGDGSFEARVYSNDCAADAARLRLEDAVGNTITTWSGNWFDSNPWGHVFQNLKPGVYHVTGWTNKECTNEISQKVTIGPKNCKGQLSAVKILPESFPGCGDGGILLKYASKDCFDTWNADGVNIDNTSEEFNTGAVARSDKGFIGGLHAGNYRFIANIPGGDVCDAPFYTIPVTKSCDFQLSATTNNKCPGKITINLTPGADVMNNPCVNIFEIDITDDDIGFSKSYIVEKKAFIQQPVLNIPRGTFYIDAYLLDNVGERMEACHQLAIIDAGNSCKAIPKSQIVITAQATTANIFIPNDITGCTDGVSYQIKKGTNEIQSGDISSGDADINNLKPGKTYTYIIVSTCGGNEYTTTGHFTTPTSLIKTIISGNDIDEEKQNFTSEQIKISSKLIIWPNPANGELNIQVFGMVKGNARIQLSDEMGAMVKEFLGQIGVTPLLKINTNGVSSGNYFIILTDSAGKQLRGKVMIQH